MIDHKLPTSWNDLQDKVGQIFLELGYKVNIAKDLKTVRGKVNVDVFSINTLHQPPISYICECKNWKRPVSKLTVQALRSIVDDYGANYGIIISRNGFQKGAIKAAKNTNIILVDWFGFQKIFEKEWIANISEAIYEYCIPLLDYSEPINSGILKETVKFSDSKLKKFYKLKQKYYPFTFSAVALKFGPHLFHETTKFKFPIHTATFKHRRKKVLRSYRDFIEYYIEFVQEGTREFDDLFGKRIRFGYKRESIHKLLLNYEVLKNNALDLIKKNEINRAKKLLNDFLR